MDPAAPHNKINISTMDKTSLNTSIYINLGTGKECMDKPPNLAHVSDEHLQGLRVAVNKEYELRQAERRELLFKLHNQGSLFDSFNDFSDETEDRDFRKRNIHST